MSRRLESLDCRQLRSLSVDIGLSHASHARSAGRLLARKFDRLENISVTLHVWAVTGELFEVPPPAQPMTVEDISVISPRGRTLWSATVMDHFLESLDPSNLHVGAGYLDGASLGFVEWAARCERDFVLSVKIPEESLGRLCQALSHATGLVHFSAQTQKARLAESPIAFEDLVDLLPSSLKRTDLTDWIFKIPPSVGVVDEPVTAFVRFPILQVSAYPDQDAQPRVVDLVKLSLEDGSYRWHECPAEPDLYVWSLPRLVHACALILTTLSQRLIQLSPLPDLRGVMLLQMTTFQYRVKPNWRA